MEGLMVNCQRLFFFRHLEKTMHSQPCIVVTRCRKRRAEICITRVTSHLEPGKGHNTHMLLEYDRLGFLLKLDSKLPAELATKYANFSEGACKPGYASALMTAIFPRFSKPAPMFLDDSFRKWARIREFVPPFGIKGQDNLIKAILSVTKEYRLTPALDSLSCRRCIIVGNGGVLANKSLGSRIDDYDIVVRLNSAPVKGFEKDVGSKTTLRITYPEGAMQRPEQYERDSLFVLAGFKWQDFKWLKYIVYKERVSWTHNIQREKEFLRKLVKAHVITDLTSGI
nr:CMP-N-acetylneuraminate-beta-1,4-galactoside alpha-2,3-sialyltransferase isoform X3 [Loxodonta africana]